MERKPCASCGRKFRPRPQTPKQIFCPSDACQKERRREWQKAKRLIDPDYRDNQAKAQHAWSHNNPDYWRQYRLAHPEYVSRNRAQQGERNERQRGRVIAKMDASAVKNALTPGIYRLLPVRPGIAKMDACTVEITVLSRPSAKPADCKERTR
jgi:hypothetical protein